MMEESKIENSSMTKVTVVGTPERKKKKKNFINTTHCRQEIDTVKYVINKYG